MKKFFFVLLAIILTVVFYAGNLIDEKAKALLQTIKLSENDAKNTIFSDISSGSSFYLPGIKELKSIAMNDRAAQVEIIGNYVKEFTKSDDFKNRYNEFRESRKPTPPEKPKTSAELKKQYQEDIQKSIEEMKTAKSQVSDDQKAFYDETIKLMEDQLKEIDNPDNPMFSPDMDKYSQMAYDQQMEAHKNDLAEWETKYPANNPKPLIKVWLESFLEQTKDVDFNAQTAIDKDRTKFVKQEYEYKNYLWKQCFRAGKETTEAGRKFAQNWMNELK